MLRIILFASGCAAAVFWIFLYLKNINKYKEITGSDAAGELCGSDMFCIGFALMKLFRTGFRNNNEKRLLISEVYGSRYADFYQYLFKGAQITYSYTVFVFATVIGAAADNAVLILSGWISSVLLLFYLDEQTKKKALEKREAVLYELPDMISRLALLVRSGMVLREAWVKISESSDSVLCQEMKKTTDDIRNGMPEIQAFMGLTERCRTREIRKFVNSLIQNLKKGNSELVYFLRAAASEQWEEKKNYVIKKSEMTEQKLIFPMMMIFAAIIIMILVPALTGMTNI